MADDHQSALRVLLKLPDLPFNLHLCGIVIIRCLLKVKFSVSSMKCIIQKVDKTRKFSSHLFFIIWTLK